MLIFNSSFTQAFSCFESAGLTSHNLLNSKRLMFAVGAIILLGSALYEKSSRVNATKESKIFKEISCEIRQNNFFSAINQFASSGYFTNAKNFSIKDDPSHTSCLVTAIKCATFLFGKKEADVISTIMGFKVLSFYSRELYEGLVDIKIKNLLLCDVYHNIDKDSNFFSLSEQSRNDLFCHYLEASYKSFSEKIENDILDAYDSLVIAGQGQETNMLSNVKEKLCGIGLRFNLNTLDKLEREIKTNFEFVDEKHQFFYWISLIASKSETKDWYDHTFIIGQEFCKQKKGVIFRVYQSWIGVATLLEDMQKRGYIDSSSGMNYEDMQCFFSELRKILVGKTTNYKYCFGYDSPISALPYYDGKFLEGMELYYYSALVNPNKIIENLTKLILINK